MAGRKQSGGRQSAGRRGKKQPLTPDDDQASAEQRIWQVVSMIPRGKVASYGQVAGLAGMPRHARLVGRTLAHLPRGSKLPWFRVVNAALKISPRGDTDSHLRQRKLLEREGVSFIGERVARAHRWEAGLGP